MGGGVVLELVTRGHLRSLFKVMGRKGPFIFDKFDHVGLYLV